jgi:hypothetical protein
MLAVVKIEAPNDGNGNPRRGWIVSTIAAEPNASDLTRMASMKKRSS